MGKGFKTTEDVGRRIVELRDTHHLEFTVIAVRVGIKPETVRRVYQKTKAADKEAVRLCGTK